MSDEIRPVAAIGIALVNGQQVGFKVGRDDVLDITIRPAEIHVGYPDRVKIVLVSPNLIAGYDVYYSEVPRD